MGKTISQQQVFEQPRTQIELPKIKIPTFSGKYTEWVTFRDMFTSLIHNNMNLDNVQKMHYLKSYLIGEAEQLLRQIPISEANYDRCWNQLKIRYDNKRFLSHHIIKRLLSQKNIVMESAHSLKELLDTTSDCIDSLANLGIDVSNWDILIIHILTLKLDPESRRQWEFSVINNSSNDLPTFEQFKDLLTKRYRALEFLDSKFFGNRISNSNVNNNSQTVTYNNMKYKSMHVFKNICLFCSEEHKINVCKKFANENVEKRRDFIMSKKACFNCLSTSHVAKSCQSNMKCKFCPRRHHTLLHTNQSDTLNKTNMHNNLGIVQNEVSEEAGSSQMYNNENNTQNSNPVLTYFSTETSNQVLLATAIVKAESKYADNYVLRALIDQGSQASLVTESTVQYLKLKKIPVNCNISGLTGDVTSKTMVYVNLKSRFNSQMYTVKAYVLKSITNLLPPKTIKLLEWPEINKLELADPDYYKPNKIDILLGAEVYPQIIKQGILKNGSVVAQDTTLGWILSGVGEMNAPTHNHEAILHCQVDEENDFLKKFWELESDISLPKEQKWTDEEKECETFFTRTTTRDETGRYVVRLPFNEKISNFNYEDSRWIAEKRLKGLEHRLKKNENLKERYKEVVDEYLDLNHAVEVHAVKEERRKTAYLPHHAVVREDKETTKVRVVFNASSKGTNGLSLNDCLMVGPTIQPELRHLVMRWRLNSICLGADIVKMYRQIKVHEDDADCQRFLWRNNPEDKVRDFKLLTVTFGTACAPFLACRTLKQIALDDGAKYPEAAERVMNEFYMDDLMTGCESVKQGIEIYKQMTELLNKGGFVLQKWVSNNDELLEKLKETDKDNDSHINIKMDNIVKILGLTWGRSGDTFHYSVKLPELVSPVTKRIIISDISRLFDPLGWITPCIILAKTMIQKLWITGIQWDDVVPVEILKEWSNFRAELTELTQIAIPRWMKTKSNDVLRELHGFCDASKVAYAAVVYLRVVDSEGNIHVSLVTAKSRVAPIKQVSIPRLELCGAVLLSRLMLEVAKILNIDKDNLYAWTDSTIVLAWLNNLPSKWKVFVANRVAEILTSFNPGQWSHVCSKLNPADSASRGMLPSELKSNMLWFHGPEFLKEESIVLNKPKDIGTEVEAVKIHNIVTEDSIWERFSTLNKMIRVIAYCRRMLNWKKSKSDRITKSYLQKEELNKALEVCIRETQKMYFQREISDLLNTREVGRKSALKSLNPYLDDKGILRVAGRLEQSSLSLARKHPIILPKKSKLTSLIILHSHKQTLHGGTQLTLNYINNKYFIIGGKQVVKSFIQKCVICVKNNGLSYNQLMGQLPNVRCTPARPFRYSAVDFAGPIQIRTARGRGHKSYKGYICIFVCMSTRAAHIEVVSDLSSESFLQSFKRFSARRGHCEEIWSDNGSNFIGAAKEIAKLFLAEKNSLKPELAEVLANNGTSWHFIPPHAPNFGGLWESGIKSVKFHLKRIIGNATLTYEELSTVLAQIEACLNSRPLWRLSSDLNDANVMTPGHFLIGEPLVTPPDQNFERSNISSLRRWKYTQRMLQDFWRRWSGEYLTQFFHRYRWASRAPEPKKGDVVLIKEDNLPPCRWLYGLVTETHPGHDGITRVVTLKTKNCLIRRPTSKLCIIPITE